MTAGGHGEHCDGCRVLGYVTTLDAIRTAYAEYEAALARREHGLLASSRFIAAVEAALGGG